MTNYREILRLHSLGLSKTEIATSCQCARNTVAATLQRSANCRLQGLLTEEMSDTQISEPLFPAMSSKIVYKMPDYAYVHKELQRSGVTLNLLGLEYCDQCRAAGEVLYQSTQFNKYYADYLAKTNATMHLNHKSGEIMQVDGAGDTAAVIDTDTSEIISAYVFVATLPYSGYSYVEAFFSVNQEILDHAHVNACKYFGGITRIIQCDNLKTGVQKHGKAGIVLNKFYQELAEHYETASFCLYWNGMNRSTNAWRLSTTNLSRSGKAAEPAALQKRNFSCGLCLPGPLSWRPKRYLQEVSITTSP